MIPQGGEIWTRQDVGVSFRAPLDVFRGLTTKRMVSYNSTLLYIYIYRIIIFCSSANLNTNVLCCSVH